MIQCKTIADLISKEMRKKIFFKNKNCYQNIDFHDNILPSGIKKMTRGKNPLKQILNWIKFQQ